MHQFVFLGSFLFLSFQMVSRALKDHIWLVADAFSKKKKQKKNQKNPHKNDKKAFIHKSEIRSISILCYRRRQILHTKTKKTPQF